MRKLLILILLSLSLGLSGQMIGIMSSQGGVAATTDNYGDESTPNATESILGTYNLYSPITVTEGGTVLSVTIYVGTQSPNCKVGIYTNSGGAPGTLLTNGTSETINLTSNSFNTLEFPTPPSVSSSTTYYVAVRAETNIDMYGTGIIPITYNGPTTFSDAFAASAGATSSLGDKATGIYITVQH